MNNIALLFNNRLFVKQLQTKGTQPIFIGRWTISGVSNSNDNVNKIFDRNNEDHCGVCVNGIKNKIKEEIKVKNNEKNIIDYETPFIM